MTSVQKTFHRKLWPKVGLDSGNATALDKLESKGYGNFCCSDLSVKSCGTRGVTSPLCYGMVSLSSSLNASICA